MPEHKDYVLCRHIGNSFFYYHPDCAPKGNDYRRVAIEDMGIGATCCECRQEIITLDSERISSEMHTDS